MYVTPARTKYVTPAKAGVQREMKKIKPIFTLICFVAIFLAYARGDSGVLPKLIIFESSNCSTCAKIKKEIAPDIEKEFKNKIQIEYRDIGDIENYKLLLDLRQKEGVKDAELSMPVFYFEGKFLQGKGKIKEALRSMIAQLLEKPASPRHSGERSRPVGLDTSSGNSALGRRNPESLDPDFRRGDTLFSSLRSPQGQSRVDLVERFKSFKLSAIVSAGLIDGINPCAFAVIIFFISFLALQGYRKWHLIFIGLGFIGSVFVTYVLIGIGLFGFIYQFKGFWLFNRIFNVSIGTLSILLGVLALWDFYKFKKSGNASELILQLPKAVKDRIHAIIGLHYRRDKGEKVEGARPRIFKLFVSALITGFLVSILEAICTGQVYLPTIAFVLKTTTLKIEAFLYILLYNLMFIAPLLIIFLLGLIGVTSGQLSVFSKKHLGLIKILMAVLFFCFAVFLFWRM